MAEIETYVQLSRINDAVDRTVYITSITQVGSTNEYTIATKNTKWIGEGKAINRTVTIGDVDYLVNSIIVNTSFNIIVATGQGVPTADSFLCNPMFFYKGTFNAVSNELTEVPISTEKTPFLFYSEGDSSDEENHDSLLPVGITAECKLFAMMDADFENWTNDKHYQFCVKAMGNYFAEFVKAARNVDFVIGESITESRSETLVKWGVYSDGKGNQRNYFNENLSGKSKTITIPFFKTGCEDSYVAPGDGSVMVVVNVDGTEYYNEVITEDTTINVVYN